MGGPGVHEASVAAQLRAIAANTAPAVADDSVAAVPDPKNGSWAQRTFAFSITSSGSNASGSSGGAGSATVSGTLRIWASGTASCVAASFGPVQFSSPARSAAWERAGLATSPTTVHQPHGHCTTAVGPRLHTVTPDNPTSVTSTGILPIDVSSLTSDPSTLATELENGTTGLPSLDKIPQTGPDVGFERAVVLLVAPPVDAGPGFPSVVYQALSLLPGVTALGAVTTPTGAAGQGFAASSAPDAEAIVLSPTGALFEIRNFVLQSATPRDFTLRIVWATLVGTYFAASPGIPAIAEQPLLTQDVFVTNWLDPVGTPTVVPTRAMPALQPTSRV